MTRLWRVVVVALLVGACSGGSVPRDGEVLVSAAASLTDAFHAIEAAFEDLHPDLDVTLNLGSSSGLRDQILEGAPVDVFASANTANMDAVAAVLSTEPVVFARNHLVIAVPAANPGAVSGLSDFARDDLLVGLCAERVPCGDYARQALALAGVHASLDNTEIDVRALLTKIEAGELDAGIVYVSDLVGRSSVEGVEIPAEHNVVAEYPIAMRADAPYPIAARSFMEFVLSGVGRRILAEYGLAPP